MTEWIRRNTTTVVVAMLTAALTVGGPAIASTIADYARNSDKVDGRHAVGAATSVAGRAGKLVATNTTGYLPDNIILKAGDAELLDGFDSSAFTQSLAVVLYDRAATMPAGAAETVYTPGWLPSWNVVFSAVPTTSGGRLTTAVETERATDGTLTYWVKVTNTGPTATGYKLRYLAFFNPASPAAARQAERQLKDIGVRVVR